MSIKKGKKQVYKVGQTVRVVQCMDKEYVGKIGTIAFLFRNGGIDVDLGDGLLVIASKVSPLKPKKSKRHVHEYIPFDANAYPTLEKYAEYHQCKCGKEKPKKSIKKTYKKDEEIEAPKTYKYLWMCDNCRKMDYVHIPLGTTVEDFIEKGFICKFCGC